MRVPKSILITLALATGGCQQVAGLARDLNLPFASRRGTPLRAVQPRPYPAKAAVAGTLDIEVIRDGRAILLDNRTVKTYSEIDLWLNQEFGGTLESIPIGRGEAISLESFVNAYGEHYPVAKFLQPDLDRTLVSAELVIDGQLHKLTVRLVEDWREP